MLKGGGATTPVKYGGRRGGRLVDRELYERIEKKYAKRLKIWSPTTEKIFKFLTHHAYKPAASQVGVGYQLKDKRWLYTAADIICRQSANEVVLVEVKCKESCYYEKSTGQLQHPFELRSNSQRNQDQLQLGFTVAMYEKTFPQDKVVGSMVLRAHSNGIHTYPLEQWVVNRMPQALRGLSDLPDDRLKNFRPRKSSSKRTAPRPTTARSKKRSAQQAACSSSSTTTKQTTKKKQTKKRRPSSKKAATA
jgi:hypothetical protein